MTEADARVWVEERFGAAVTEKLACFAEDVCNENQRQNLISPATIPTIWSRHIVDSLQLIGLARRPGPWLDIGTGGGFPGLVLAIAGVSPVTLVEPRRKRAAFLQACVDRYALSNVMVAASKVEQIQTRAATISARAVASVENLLRAAAHCATPDTQWLLPRGSVDPQELAQSAERHGMMFHVEQSLTQTGSAIVVLSTR